MIYKDKERYKDAHATLEKFGGFAHKVEMDRRALINISK